MSLRPRMAFLLSVIFASIVVAQVPSTYEPVKESACESSNTLGKSPKLVPRVLYNPFLSRTPSDLGRYEWFNCTGVPSNELCTPSFDSLTDDISSKLRSPSPESPLRYVIGTYIYVALAVLIAILVPLCTGLVIFCWYCTRCCCRHDRCVNLRCGLPHPTRRSTCTPGFRIRKDKTIGYSTLDRYITKFFYLVFLVFVIAVAISAEIAGNQKLSSGLESLFDSDEGIGADIARMVRNVRYPASNFAMDLNEVIIVPLLQGVTTTVTDALNLPASLDTVHCIRDSLLTMGSFTNFDTLVADMKDQFTGPTGLKSYIAAAETELTNLEGAVTSFETQVTTMQGAQSTWTAEDADILAATVQAQVAYTPYHDYCQDFGVSPTGLAQVLEADLQKLEAPTYPAAADFENIAGSAGAPTALYNLATGGAYTSADVATLETDLTALHTTLASIDLSAIPAALTTLHNDLAAAPAAFDAAATTANGLLTALSASAVDIHTSRQSYFGDFCTEVGNLSPAAFIGAIEDAENAMRALTLDPVRDMLHDAYSVLDVLPCVDDTIDIIQNVSDNIIEVPAEIDGIIDDITNFRDDVEDIENVIDAGVATLDTVDANIATMIADMDSQYTDAMDTLDDRIAEFTGKCAPTNEFNEMLLNAQNVKATPTAISTTETNAANLHAYLTGFASNFETFHQDDFLPFYNSFTATLTDMESTIAEAHALARGHCSVALTSCLSDPDCPGGETCDGAGTPRCWDPSTLEVTQTTCTTDADCGGPGTCLGDSTRMSAVRDNLLLIKDSLDVSAPLADLTALRTEFDAALGTVNSHYGNDLNTLLLGYGLSDDALTQILDAATTEIIQFPLGDLRTLLDDVNTEIDNFDFAQLEADANAFANSVDTILTPDVLDQVNNAVTFMVVLNDALFTYIPDKANLLTRTYLEQIDDSRGLYGLVEELANEWLDVYESVKQDLEDAGFTLVDLPDVDIMKHIDDVGKYADRLYSVGDYVHTSVASKNGALHYLLHLAMSDPEDKFVAPDYPDLYSVFTDIHGQSYPGNRICLLSQCLERTITTLNNAKVEEWTDVIPDFELSYYPLLSRESLFSIPLIFPFVVVFFGILGFVSPIFANTSCGGCCDNPRRQKIPVACMIGNIICQLPIMFLLSGILFSLSLTSMDMCATGVNVGANFIAVNGDRLCSIVEGTGTWDNCQLSTTIDLSAPSSSATETIQIEAIVNFPQTYKHIAGGCTDPSDPAQNEILRLLNSASAQVRDNLDKVATFYIGDVSDTTPSPAGINLRTPIRQLASSTVVSASDVVENLLTRLGEPDGPLGCNVVHEAVNDAMDSVCCNVVTPFWWYASAWFLIAWAYLLCGIPAGCKARKRLPTRVWGPSLYALLEREEKKRNKAVFLANREAVHEYLRFRKHTDFDYSLLDAESVSKESYESGRADNPLAEHTNIEMPLISSSKRAHLTSGGGQPTMHPDTSTYYANDGRTATGMTNYPAPQATPYTVPKHDAVSLSDIPPHLRNEV